MGKRSRDRWFNENSKVPAGALARIERRKVLLANTPLPESQDMGQFQADRDREFREAAKALEASLGFPLNNNAKAALESTISIAHLPSA